MMDLQSALNAIRSGRAEIEPVYFCEHVDGQGLFAVVKGMRVPVSVDCWRKIDQETANGICDATGLDWGTWSDVFEKYWLNQCDCGKRFIAKSHNRKFCSSDCCSSSAVNRQKSYRTANQERRQAKIKNLKCNVCGKAMDGTRLSKQFCSARCRQIAVRKWYKP